MRIARIVIGVGVGALVALLGCTEKASTEANSAHDTPAVNDHPVHEESGPAPTNKPGSKLQKRVEATAPIIPEVEREDGGARLIIPPPAQEGPPTK